MDSDMIILEVTDNMDKTIENLNLKISGKELLDIFHHVAFIYRDYDEPANEEECTYNEETRLLICTKTVELNENNQTIEATFNIKVTYKNLTSLTNLNILNKVLLNPVLYY